MFVLLVVVVVVVVLRLSLLSEFWENPEIYPNKHHLGGPKSPGRPEISGNQKPT